MKRFGFSDCLQMNFIANIPLSSYDVLVKDSGKRYLSCSDMETALFQFVLDIAFFSLSQVS